MIVNSTEAPTGPRTPPSIMFSDGHG